LNPSLRQVEPGFALFPSEIICTALRVDFHLGVFGVDEQLFPQPERVGDVAGLAFVCVLFGAQLEFDASEDGQALFLAHGAAVGPGVLAQPALEPVEPLAFEEEDCGEGAFVAGFVELAARAPSRRRTRFLIWGAFCGRRP